MSDSPQSALSLAERLALLEQRRAALQRIIRIAHALENLQHALQAVLSLNQSARAIPVDALRAFNALGQKVRNLPDVEVKLRVARLDHKIKAKLQTTLILANELDAEAPNVDAQQLDVIQNLVDEFKRLAQTSVALRVLLERRGIHTPPIQTQVPEASIQERIGQIETRETQCRQTIILQVQDMQREVGSMRRAAGCTPAMQRVLEQMSDALAENLEHLLSGKPISELPVPLADIEIETTPESQQRSIFTEKAATSGEPPAAIETKTPEPPEAQPSAITGLSPEPPPAIQAVKKTAHATQAQPEASRPPERPPAKGLWGKFRRWLDTPWNVGWKDIDEGKDRDRKDQ